MTRPICKQHAIDVTVPRQPGTTGNAMNAVSSCNQGMVGAWFAELLKAFGNLEKFV